MSNGRPDPNFLTLIFLLIFLIFCVTPLKNVDQRTDAQKAEDRRKRNKLALDYKKQAEREYREKVRATARFLDDVDAERKRK